MFESDTEFAELNIILRWLRRYSPEITIDDIYQDDNYRSDRGWMYTKENIKSQKRKRPGKHQPVTNSFTKNSVSLGLVTELDPDAPTRQRGRLENEDIAWETYFLKLLWGFIRKGQFSEARDLCVDAGESWRAASIAGGRHSWDPKIDGHRAILGVEEEEMFSEVGEDPNSVKGNRNRELWKRMCWAIARGAGGQIHEKAVYGVLCGDVESASTILMLSLLRLTFGRFCLCAQRGKIFFLPTSTRLWRSFILPN